MNLRFRFAVFADMDYYPRGGISDLIGVFETSEEAMIFASSIDRHVKCGGYDNVEVVDLLNISEYLEIGDE